MLSTSSLSVAMIGFLGVLAARGDDRSGATWWSLRPIAGVEPPVMEQGESVAGIDAFIRARLEQEGLSSSPPADLATLVRRVCFDLTGLPPEPGTLDRLVAESEPGAYERYVDALLASPAYGERWARHWLDVARYGESNGFEYNEPRRHAWPYRDWVIAALNADLPYDAFARMQIAGDILDAGADGAAAVGFLVAGVHNTVMGAGELMKLQARQDELEEIIGTVGQVFLGVTVQCARCHDHKVDPVPTEDYYRIAAALAGVWHGERTIGRDGADPLPVHTVAAREPGPMRIHRRGSAADLGEEVMPGGLRAIAGVSQDFGLDGGATDAERRRALAEWITDPGNPLFPRVMVNRVWHHHFGTGIVATPNDFGANGALPSHPDLLDWLAEWFRTNGYSLKALHRLIVTSATYRQASASRPDALARDASTRLLWRFPPRRVEAEVLRDAMLAAAGVLNREMGGPGYEDVREEHFNAGRYYHPIDPDGPAFRRRSIYRFSPRGGRSALLDTFDCPDPSVTAPRRAVTTTPLQALSLQHNPFVWRMADLLAERVTAGMATEAGLSTVDLARHAWELALGSSPSSDELELAASLVERHGLPALCRALFNSGNFTVIE